MILDNRVIKHEFPFINIRQVPREVFKTKGEAWRVSTRINKSRLPTARELSLVNGFCFVKTRLFMSCGTGIYAIISNKTALYDNV